MAIDDELDAIKGSCDPMRQYNNSSTALEEAYRDMAADQAREREAEEWSEGLIGDALGRD
jgi:hypothetical protein